MHPRLLCVAAALLTNCGPATRSSGERLPEPPRFAAQGASCPVLFGLRQVEAEALAIVHEQTAERAFLGRLSFDGAWHRLDQTTHDAFHLGAVSVSVSPRGDVFAGLLDQDETPSLPQLHRAGESGWQSVLFEEDLTSWRTNLPRVLSLDASRAAVTFFETGGVAPEQQGTFLWEDGAWVTVEPMGRVTGRSYHRGPGTELWRVRLPDPLGRVYFDAWTGSGFRELPLSLEVSKRGFVRALRPVGDKVMVLFDTSDNFGYGFELFEISEYGAALVATAPVSELRPIDLSFDLQRRPVITLQGYFDDGGMIRAYRLEHGEWRQVYSAEIARYLDGSAAATVVDNVLLVGWTESEQQIDFPREHHTDCRISVDRTLL